MRNVWLAWMVAVTAAPLFAHHGDTNYDLTTPFSISGTIAEFRFINPTCRLRWMSSMLTGR